MHQTTLEIGLFAATAFTYVTMIAAIFVAGVRRARRFGETLSPFRLWVAGAVAAYGGAFWVAAWMNNLL